MTTNTLISRTPTTVGAWALLIAKAIESYGLDSATLFQEAGISLPEIQNNAEMRLPVKQMAVLWALAVERSGDPCFALRLTQFFQPSTYSAVGLAIASSRNVLEGLHRSLRYFKLTTDAAVLSLEEREETVVLTLAIPPEHQPVANEAVEAFSATIISLFRLMTNETFAPVDVTYVHAKPQGVESFQAFFQCPVEFDRTENQMVFRRSDLEQPHMLANPTLASTLDDWICEHIQKLSQDLTSTKVQAYILDNLLLADIDIEQVASHLNLGLRTLQRRLKAEGKSFNELLDECRHHLAIKLVVEQQVQFTEISYMLGFADQSSFTRAFRRWTGMNPKQYRG